METNTKSEVLFNNIVYYAFSILAGLFSALLDAMAFSEWWIVSIEEDIHDYHFGDSNSGPWYYASAEQYSTIFLMDWIVLTALLALTVRFMIKKQRKWVVISLLACLAYSIIMHIMGTVE